MAGKRRKRHAIKRKFIIILLLASLAVGATGYITYVSLHRLVDNIEHETKPDVAPRVLREIYSDIAIARNSVRAYILTNDSLYLKPYYQTANNVDSKLRKLKKFMSDDKVQSVLVDSIGIVAHKKLDVLKATLKLYEGDQLAESLFEINRALQEATIKDAKWLIKTKETHTTHIEEVPHEKKKVADTLIEVHDSYDKNREKAMTNVLSYLNDEEGYTAPQKPEKVKKEKVVIEKEPVKIESYDLEALQEVVSKIGSEGIEKYQKARAKELELTWEGKVLMDKLKNLVDQVEKRDVALSKKSAEEARFTATVTVDIVIILCVVSMIILLTAGYIVFVYIKKDNKYKKILKIAKNRAEGLAKAKENFLANMSHEIRTPLNAIIGFGQELETTKLSKKQKEYINTIRLSSDHLLRIINEILDFSKLESGELKLEYEPFQPKEVLNNVIKSFERSANTKGIGLILKVDKAVPDTLIGDEVRLQQILLNLVGNAVKFTSEGEVKVSCLSIAGGEQHVLLTIKVEDSGIGIAENKKHKIFKEFDQGDNSIARKFGGTGLGLSICKRLVGVMGGEIKVYSKIGVGSTFIVSIPYEVSTEEIKEGAKQKYKGVGINKLSGKKVLVVDDEQYNRQLIDIILKHWEIDVSYAENGQEAIEKIKANDYDIVLMDARMPVMNGEEAVKYIRNELKQPKCNVPVIALTAAVTKEDIIMYQDAGMNDVLPKPFDREELFHKLMKLLNHRKVISVQDDHQNELSYDVSALYDLGDGDEDFVKEMLETYVYNTKESLNIISAAFEEGDMEKVEIYAHKVVSPSKHLGLDHLVELYKQLEKLAETREDLQEMARLIMKISDKTDLILQQIEQDLKEEYV